MVENRRTDHDKLVSALRELAPSIRPSSDRTWSREPAVRVLDCVLSLNRPHDALIVATLDRFAREHPGIRTVPDLQALMARYQSPSAFVTEVLNYRPGYAGVLSAIVRWLATVSGGGSYAEQLSNLQRWAAKAAPSDHQKLLIKRFGLAGFQYLRMLFGANTTKAESHIRRFVTTCIGREVSAMEAVNLLEEAALETGISLRDLDTTIWESSARGNSTSYCDR